MVIDCFEKEKEFEDLLKEDHSHGLKWHKAHAQVIHEFEGVEYAFPEHPELTTILEYNRLPLKADRTEDICVLLLDTEMNSALKVQELLIKGDKKMLAALSKLEIANMALNLSFCLCYDFSSNKPMIKAIL